jgi:hypothetical protein
MAKSHFNSMLITASMYGVLLSILGAAVRVNLQQHHPRNLVVPGNPILFDGSFYSADPAPFVVNNTFYILCGRDEAPSNRRDFVMNEWQILSTKEPGGKDWTHHPAIARSNSLLSWAAPGRAFAAQIVPRNGKYYMYAQTFQANTPANDKFAIAVSVSDGPIGPFRDAHPEGPIFS